MTDTQDLAAIRFNFKRQTAAGAPEAGAGGYSLDILPSQGLQAQVQTIESGLIKANKMKKRGRRGSGNTTASYETELVKTMFEELALGVLGANAWTAQVDTTESTLTSCVISGTGVTATFGAGTLSSIGFRAGQMVRFTNLSVAGNNGVWVPVVAVNDAAKTLTFPSGYLADNASDTAFTISIARNVITPATYQDNFYSVEEYLTTIDRSKFAADARFNSLVFTESPNAYGRVGFSLGARTLEMKVSGSSPVFTAPTTPSGESLSLLDGGLYVNGVRRSDLTAFTVGITAPVTTTPVIGSLTGPAAKVGTFVFSGSVSGVVTDGVDFDAFSAETDISIMLHWKDKNDETGIALYVGNLQYGGYSSAAAGEGDQVQTMQLYGGDDDRGTGYAATTFLLTDLIA